MIERLKDFLKNSYTPYHAVKNAAEILEENGFLKLSEGEDWDLRENGRYYVKRSGAIVAFTVGALDEGLSYKIAASHTDSPALKLKDNAVFKTDVYQKLNAEGYGGGIWYSFFDRPLKIAGRAIVNDGNALTEEVVVSDYFVTIPSLAIHQQRNVNDGISVNLQTDACPLYALEQEENDLLPSLHIANAAAYDLFLVNGEEPYIFGRNGEFFASPRIDNLTSVFCSIDALCAVKAPDGICVAAAFDNEETGSRSVDGACGDLLERTLKRIAFALKFNEDEYYKALYSSFLLSVDNAHALHPNHPEKCDPTNRPVAGGGVVVKFHADKAYTTDALSAAIVFSVFENANVPYQKFYNRSDVRSGSTLGALSLLKVCVPSADIGIAQFAMHSACESFAVKDLSAAADGLKAFFAANIRINDNGAIVK